MTGIQKCTKHPVAQSPWQRRRHVHVCAALLRVCQERDGEEAIEQEGASESRWQNERVAGRAREKNRSVEQGERKEEWGWMLVIGEERVRVGWAREKTATMYRSTGWWAASWLSSTVKNQWTRGRPDITHSDTLSQLIRLSRQFVIRHFHSRKSSCVFYGSHRHEFFLSTNVVSALRRLDWKLPYFLEKSFDPGQDRGSPCACRCNLQKLWEYRKTCVMSRPMRYVIYRYVSLVQPRCSIFDTCPWISSRKICYARSVIERAWRDLSAVKCPVKYPWELISWFSVSPPNGNRGCENC